MPKLLKNSAMKAFGFFFHLLLLLLLLLLSLVHAEVNFTFNGFLQANLSMDGASLIKSDGILVLTNDSIRLLGHAFYPSPLQFKKINPENETEAVTFSTSFVFSINPKYPDIGGHGLAFFLMPTKYPRTSATNQYLGLPNDSSINGRFLAVEFDIVQNPELQDINDNHVGIDISSLISNVSEPAAYYYAADASRGEHHDDNRNNTIVLKSGKPIQAWVDYDSKEMLMNVSISPLRMFRPRRPLISLPIDLSLVLDEYMYVGFSGSTDMLTALQCVHGWSFTIGGRVQDLDSRKLPLLKTRSVKVVHKKGFAVGISLASIAIVFLVVIGSVHMIIRIRKGDDNLEDWEIEYGARRFKYFELYSATRGFGEKNLISSGGFGRVYKGVIPSTRLEVAIKRVSNGSHQGMKEFVAEITSMGRLRHRNLVHLHGWCQKKDELILVYDYYTNGSLDKHLYEDGPLTRVIDPTLNKNYHSVEAELVLTLGLLCSHPSQDYRLTMRRVVHFLQGDATLPPLPRDIHMEVPMAITEDSNSFTKDSDPSFRRIASSHSNSSTSFDNKLSNGHTTRLTF